MQLQLATSASAAPTTMQPSRLGKGLMYGLLACIMFLAFLTSAGAVDLETFAGITGPLTTALTQISLLTPGFKAIVGLVGFLVAFIALAGMRNFGPVIFYIGLAIFGAVGLTVAGAIMGAVV